MFVSFVTGFSLFVVLFSVGVIVGRSHGGINKGVIVKHIILLAPYIVFGVWGLLLIKRGL